MFMETDSHDSIHRVGVVVPVYRGQWVLEPLLHEIAAYAEPQQTPSGLRFQVMEVVLVHDGAVDDSERVMRALKERHAFVRLLWLSRNYGQHAATLAGMASTTADWVVTMDEDGQHDPADIGAMLDRALAAGAQLVYAQPRNAAPHSRARNAFSLLTKRLVVSVLGAPALREFHSFRLIHGEVARSLAAFCANTVYLDVALSWVVARSAHCPVTLRQEGRAASGYTRAKLLSHFWRLVIASGTRPLRMIAAMGCLSILLAMGISSYALYEKLAQRVPVQGWTSMMIVICLFSGIILLSISVLAEYLGVVVGMAMGRPLYLSVSRPCPQPLTAAAPER